MNARLQPKLTFNLAAKVKKDAAASGVPVKIKSKAALRRLAELLK
jgi:hypothetical protein